MKNFVWPLLLGLSSIAYAVAPTNPHAPKPSAQDEMHLSMVTMCNSMDSMKMTGSLDNDFLLMMIPHHQSAVDMAKAYLKEGTDPEIRAAAEKVIETQQKEITEMQAWLKAHPVDAQQTQQ